MGRLIACVVGLAAIDGAVDARVVLSLNNLLFRYLIVVCCVAAPVVGLVVIVNWSHAFTGREMLSPLGRRRYGKLMLTVWILHSGSKVEGFTSWV